MQKQELILLGKIVKGHGFHGAVIVALEGDFFEKISEMESVFVEIDGTPVPFFIETIREAGRNSVIIRFEFYDTIDKISEFTGCMVYAENQPGLTETDLKLPIHFVGYRVFNSDGDELGEIAKVISFPMQVMFELKAESGNEILIPYNEDWIVTEDIADRRLTLALPEGLDSLNL